MPNKVRNSLFLTFSLVTVMITFFLNPIIAFADEGTNPPTPVEPVVVEEPTAEVPVVVEASAPETNSDVIEQLPEDVQLVVVDESGDSLALATIEAADAIVAPDPYFWVGGNLYEFTAVDCDPITAGDQGCATPIQSAIDFLSANDYTPDDGNIYVEAGTYDEDVYINGASWFTTPVNLGLVGIDGSASTTINGSIYVESVYNFWLDGFNVNSTIFVDSFGDVTVSDVTVQNNADYANLYVVSDGYIYISDSSSTGSGYDGAYLDSGSSIYIENSEFSNNGGSGVNAASFGDITLNYVSANSNGYDGANLNSSSSIFVENSDLSLNGGSGVNATSSGDIIINNVSANTNGYDGAYLTSSSNIFVENSEFINNSIDSVDAETSNDIVINNNLVEGAGFDGLLLNGWNIFVHNNDLINNGEYDLYADFRNYLEVCDTTFTSETLVGCEFYFAEEEVVEEEDPKPATIPATETTTSSEPVIASELPEITLENLPAPLPATLSDGSTFTFAGGFNAASIDIKPGETVEISFSLPAGINPANLAILMWDGTGWVELTDFIINPDGTIQLNITFAGEIIFGQK